MRLLFAALRAGLGLIAIILILALGFIVERLSWLPRSVAPQSGELAVNGLRGEVRIVRDRNDVPHISGASAEDVYFGLGFAHAQDRLWQMAFYRRALEGRLSEILGSMTVRTDTFLRALDLEGRARDCLSHLSPETRAALDAYAAGVNAWVDAHRANLPPEFHIFMTGFEPWRPEHSILMLKFMAMDLSDNAVEEVAHARLDALLGAARAAELFPPPSPSDPITMNEATATQHASLEISSPPWRQSWAGEPLDAHASRVAFGANGQPDDASRWLGGASNNWVVSGALTRSGRPLLANDPHLGLSAPGIWYLAHLALPTGDVVGATIPGIPSIVLGHNSYLAWGFTTAQVDTEDLVIETLDPQDHSRYLVPDGSLPFKTRTDKIKVRLGGTVTVTLRETRDGPVLPVIAPAQAQVTPKDAVMALAAVGLSRTDTTMNAAIEMMSANSLDALNVVLANFQSPMQNIVYADTAGDIGYAAPGLVPVRGPNAPAKSLVPADGKVQDPLWQGFIPYAELPHMLNPPSGRIYTANNKIVPDDYRYFLAADWPAGYRARRIGELLGTGTPFGVDDMTAMQKDDFSPDAADLLPLMLTAKPAGPREAQALKLMASWDDRMSADRPEPLIYIAWASRLQQLITADELGKLAGEMRGLKPEFLVRVLRNTDGMAHWCDDVTTTTVTEGCAEMISRALEGALDVLTRSYGEDMTHWRWDAAHIAMFDHQALGSIPVISALFNRRIPAGGGPNSLDRGDMAYAGPNPYADIHGAGLRAAYDLSDLARSRFMIAIGQSGNPLSPYYDDLMKDWAAGRTFEIPTDEALYTEDSLGTWILRPATTGR